jgi:hypothetical protein
MRAFALEKTLSKDAESNRKTKQWKLRRLLGAMVKNGINYKEK